MTRWLTGVITALLVLGLAAIAAPQIHVDSETYDFGSIVEGYTIEHTFILSNVGDETLIIGTVRVTCGCTTTELATNELEPGESVDLHVVVTTGGSGGQPNFSRYVYVYSNDPEYPESEAEKLILRIEGSILRNEPYSKAIEDLYMYSILLVDLRGQAEFAAGHLLGAVNILPDDLAGTLGGVSVPDSTVIVLYDETGALAGGVADDLVAGGFPLARALTGGLAGWAQAYGNRYFYPEPASLDFGDPAARATKYLDPTHVNDAFYVFVDLRMPEAFANGHLFGAVNIPNNEFSVASLDDRLGDLPSDAEIIVYDQTGVQSDTVAQDLIAAGYAGAKSLLGGLDEWQRVYGDELIWPDTP